MNKPKNGLVRPALISVEEAKRLNVADVSELFRQHVNPGQLHFLKLLGFHEVLIDRAEGMFYTDKSGRKILDFFGGFGAVALGHNHPRILEVRRRFQEEKRHEIAMAFMSQYASALAKNLAVIAPGDLDMVFLGHPARRRLRRRSNSRKRCKARNAPPSRTRSYRFTARRVVPYRSPTYRFTARRSVS